MNAFVAAAKGDDLMSMQVAQAGMAIPASQQLGLQFQQDQYNRRLEALIDPGPYAGKRATAFNSMTASVDAVFTQAMEKYLKTKMPPDMARKFAMQAADNERQIQQQILEATFPSGANVIGMERQVATANIRNYPGGVSAQRAPARRKPARRKPAKRR